MSSLNNELETLTIDPPKETGGVGMVDGRARRLPLTDRLSKRPDYYLAVRDHYAKRRSALVEEARHGGQPARDEEDETARARAG